MTIPDTSTGAEPRLKPALAGRAELSPGARRCRRKFLELFSSGFRDKTYVDAERGHKWEAYEKWCAVLRRGKFRSLLDAGDYDAIAQQTVSIESLTNLLSSSEKLALRNAVGTRPGARAFTQGLWDFLHGSGTEEERFQRWVDVLGNLPRVKARVLTWPVATVFGFIAQPERHVFLKPLVTRRAADAYGCEFEYAARPNWRTYVSLLEFAEQVREDQRDLGPRDMIDLQSFIWVQGSKEY